MPFQVTFSQKAIPAGIIQAIDAGMDANAICDVSFTLTASVIGDLQGHTIVWEQVLGTPVTFTTPLDQLTISYNQTTFDDKTFRFYVDKGTAFESFDDVSVFGSPTTSHRAGISSAGNYTVVNSTTSLQGEMLDLQLITPFPLAPHKGVYAKETYTSFVLLWESPITDHEIVGFIVKERNNVTGVWNDIATLPPNTNLFSGVTLGNSYQISTIFQYANSHIGQTGSKIIWASGNLTESPLIIVESATSAISAVQRSVNTTNYDVESLVIVNHNPTADETNSSMSVNVDQMVITYGVEQLTITKKSLPFDSVSAATQSITTRSLVTYDYDVTVQTGGQIGGN